MKEKKIMFSDLNKIWENIDSCINQYRCATELCLLSILAYPYDIIIYHDVGALGHVIDVVDSLNVTAIF